MPRLKAIAVETPGLIWGRLLVFSLSTESAREKCQRRHTIFEASLQNLKHF
jgi:hypothetical protein